MRILHIANFSWFSSKRKRADNLARYYAMDRKISNGLIRNGHCVWDFSYRDAARYLSPLGKNKAWGAKAMNAALLAHAKVFAPELILLGHCELLTADTLAALRQSLPNTKIAQWWVDPFASHSLPHLRQKQPYLNAFFATTAPEYYAPLIKENNSRPAMHYLPNIVDSSIEIKRAFDNKNYLYDVFFAGANAPERAALLDSIVNMPNIRAGFFGFGGRAALSGAALPNTIAAAKIGLNLSRAANIPLYTSDRLAQLAGNGCAVIMPRIPYIEKLFTDNEVVYFSDDAELPAVVSALLKDESSRQAIAKNGWRRAHNSYNEKRVCQFIIEATTGESFSQKYEWLPFSQK